MRQVWRISSKCPFRFTIFDTYLQGGTPNPCVECNRTMKFGKLYALSKELDCQYIATGHYAQIKQDASGRYLLSTAKDMTKDQTYVLWQLSQKQLSRVIFPLLPMRLYVAIFISPDRCIWSPTEQPAPFITLNAAS